MADLAVQLADGAPELGETVLGDLPAGDIVVVFCFKSAPVAMVVMSCASILSKVFMDGSSICGGGGGGGDRAAFVDGGVLFVELENLKGGSVNSQLPVTTWERLRRSWA